MQVIPTGIPGCLLLRPAIHRDPRGWLVKTFHRPEFTRLGLPTDFAETFYTRSEPGVLRGLHFQLPPHQHVKLVSCLAGAVLDVLVDLRLGSPSYRQHELLPLSAEDGALVLIPAGLAHGFLVREGPAVVAYQTSTPHAPQADGGIHWASAGVPWPLPGGPPLTSARDAALPRLDDFDTPFRFGSDPNETGPTRAQDPP